MTEQPLRWPMTGESVCEAPPWPSWAAVLSKKHGLASEAQALCRELTRALQSAETAPTGAALSRLRELLQGRCAPRRVDGWLLDVLSRDRDDAAGSAASRAAMTLTPLLLGRETSPWFSLSEATAPMIALIDELASIWLDRGVERARGALIGATLLTACGDAPALLDAWAGAQDDARRRRARAVLSRSETLRELEGWWTRTLDEARSRSLSEHTDELLAGLDGVYRWLESYARFRGLIEAAQETTSLEAEVDEAIELCSGFLWERDDWSDSWEVRRRGLAGSREHLIGSWFHRGFILRCLWRMGARRPERLTALLAEEGIESLRWFGGARVIPPDADSLGLALDLCARPGVEVELDRVEAWLEAMALSTPAEGVVPTWFLRDREGPTLDDAELRYRGEDCVAVRLALIHGLLAFDARRFAELIETNLERVLDGVADGHLRPLFFYPDGYAEELFFRVKHRFARSFATSRLLQPLDELGEALLDRLRGRQRREGSFGGAQATAWCLSSLVQSGGDPAAQARAVRFLVETLRPDGSWAAEPFYVMPGRGEAPSWHLGRSLTTAVCGVALSMYGRR